MLLGLSLFSDKMIVLGLKDASADCQKIQFIWLGLQIFQWPLYLLQHIFINDFAIGTIRTGSERQN